MRYEAFHLPTGTYPKTCTILTRGVTVFKSKTKLTYHSLHFNTTTIVIDKQIHADCKEILSEYITLLNIFRQEYSSVLWLSRLNLDDSIKFNDLNNFIKSEICTNTARKHPENFKAMGIHLRVYNKEKYSFLELFNKFHILEKGSFEKELLRFVSVSNPISMITSRIYENALFESSMLFQAFEAMLNQYYPVTEDQKSKCIECNKINSPGMHYRIKSFFSRFESVPKIFIEAIIKHYENRNKFFHALKGKSHFEYINKAIETKGSNELSFEDDIRLASGTIQAVDLLKFIIITEIFDRLDVKPVSI